METIFLLNFAVSMCIVLLLSIKFLKHYRNHQLSKPVKYLFFIGGLYLIIAVFSFLWFFNVLNYVKEDFLFIYSLIVLIQTMFFFIIAYIISQNKKLFYFLIFYLIIFFFVLLLGIHFMALFLVASFLFTLLVFIGLILTKDEFRKSAYFGILYSSFSVFFYVLYFLNIGSCCIYSFLSGVFLFVFLLFFMKNLEENPPSLEEKQEGKRHYFFIFLSHFVFMLVLINFVFIGTIVLHEFGHLGMSSFYDCEAGKIVYEDNFPKTEILCSDLVDNRFVLLGGLILPLLVSLLLILVGGKFLKEIGLLMAGFNLVVSYQDFLDLGISDNLIMFFIIFGIFLAIAGIVLLARSKTEEYMYSLSQI